MESTSRQAGWAAVANSRVAREAFDAWQRGACNLTIGELILARDFAAMNCKRASVVEAINGRLREAVALRMESSR